MTRAFSLVFDCDNAAFDEGDDPTYAQQAEVARILGDVAARVLRGEREGKVYDLNGNGVGAFLLPDDE
jgi:hypothetical protein